MTQQDFFATPEPANATTGSQASKPEQDIDLAALAKKIYELLKQEARLERERLGRG